MDGTETNIGADYACNDYKSLTTRLIGFHARVSYGWTLSPNDVVSSLALIVDTENCETASFTHDPSILQISDMTYEIADTAAV